MARKREAPQRSLFDSIPEQTEQGEITAHSAPSGGDGSSRVGSHADRILASRATRQSTLIDAIPFEPLSPKGQTAHDGVPSTQSSEQSSLSPALFASGEKLKAHHLLNAIRALKVLESENRPASLDERRTLSGFCGLGPVALSIFPNPATGQYKDASWQMLGEQLKSLLTPEEYTSARRTTFCAFYSSDTVISAIHSAIKRLGVPPDGLVLEPGCGIGLFMRPGYRYLGIEQDSITARIARALHPETNIKIEDFAQTKLPPLDAVVGNVPFADIPFTHNGQKFSLHDGFIAKATDSLAPGGVLALITSHFTLDKQNAAIREYLAEKADFLGAIRLPSDAFKREGTHVVTDIVFLRKRSLDEPPNHAGEWLETKPLDVDGAEVSINRYFLDHPEMVLGNWSRKDTLYGEGYSVTWNGDLAEQLKEAVERLPELPRRSSCVMGPKTRAPTNQNTEVAANPQKDGLDSPEIKFVPPPPERHISEGSFFLHEHRVHQIIDGQSQPVTYGGSELWAHGGLVGRRMAALIGLRDKARRVLQSQNEGWPDAARQDARRDLNRAYDSFLSAYGPINKTTFSEAKDGTTIRRMPNLVKFREDPDAMLVMALEEYDEETGTAKKAPIMQRDVVGKAPPVTHVESAEEGLLVSLDHKGCVDLPYISNLYGKQMPDVIGELGDLIYLVPETQQWQTADQYLSGNVRAKLSQAEAAGIVRNIEALKAVQPEDVLPGDIDANLGAPWIPASDVQAFAADLFRVPLSSITIAHLEKDAVWSVEGNYQAQQSVATTTDYGTSRASGLWLLELGLNQKSPTIYDPVPGDPDRREINQEATLAAKEKQRAIKEQFREWVFSDADRTERLVRIYNDTYNSLRARVFDGSHLAFPGMSQAITLRQHQRDAIWRIMSGGNTLLAHVVGSGKTFTAVAAGMKMKQAGLVKKPMFVVMNHMLEQFAREAQQLYPNAHFLVAGKDDLARDRRKQLTAKIASGDYDGIIVTHSGFERIGLSQDFQEKFLREQIAEYDGLLVERAVDRGRNRNLLKTIEKQKAAREAKLKDLLAEEKKDSGLVFDELGVDHVVIDECFTYDTLIETDKGPLKIGDIVSNRLAVKVKTFGSSRNAVVWKPVVNWFANTRKGPLVEVVHESGSFICTPSHKVWIADRGYKKVCEVVPGEELLALQKGLHSAMRQDGAEAAALFFGMPRGREDNNQNVRILPAGIPIPDGRTSARCQVSLLRTTLQDAGAMGEARNQRGLAKGNAASLGERPDEGAEESGHRSMAQGEQCHEPTGSERKDLNDSPDERNHLPEWMAERISDRTSTAPCRLDGDDNGTRHLYAANLAYRGATPPFLQSGFCRPESKTRCRSGRELPSSEKDSGARREKGASLISSRVVRITILEPGSDGEYRFGGRTHQVVYDIEVADNHNYFANGVLVSNCQAFKNLEVASKMDRVAGIQTGGSERAFDLFMKCQYLHEQHPGHGVTFASGTPISNSMVEMYTQQRYLDPAGLEARGIGHFDAWAATFGEVVESMEIAPDGKSLRPRSRFAKFVNLPELQQMFRSFADVQTAEMLDLPRPKLETGKPIVIACPMSDEQHEIQNMLVERYERIRSQKVDPREDNALAITTDGRKLALDARMLDGNAPDFPGSKINALIANVKRIWEQTKDKRGTQIIFSDFGVNATNWEFSVYEEIIHKLSITGIPREQIADIGDADTDSKKQALFEKVRQGAVRVLLGSTSKLGTGTNVQRRLVALHHLDAPWKPAEVEQRDGRILRQGNTNEEVAIYRYVTEGSFDAFMWQTLETKAKFINQVMRGETGVRRADDVGEQCLSFSEVKALASGRSEFLTLAETDAELQRLGVLRRNHMDAEFLARRNVRELPEIIARQERRLSALNADKQAVMEHESDGIVIGGKQYGDKDALAVLDKMLARIPGDVDRTRRVPLGQYAGLDFGLERHPGGATDVYLDGQASRLGQLSKESQGPRAVMNALHRVATSYDDLIERIGREHAINRQQLADYQARIGKPFPHADYIEELAGLRDQLKIALSDRTPVEGEPTAAELAERIKVLRDGHKVEAAPMRKVVKPERALKVREPVAVVEPIEEEPPPVVRQWVSGRPQQRSLF